MYPFELMTLQHTDMEWLSFFLGPPNGWTAPEQMHECMKVINKHMRAAWASKTKELELMSGCEKKETATEKKSLLS